MEPTDRLRKVFAHDCDEVSKNNDTRHPSGFRGGPPFDGDLTSRSFCCV